MTKTRLFHLLAASLLSAASLGASAGPTPPAVRADIDALMARMSASGCQFERNGRWHSAPDARQHLLRKLSYIERRGTLASAEQFIDLAASQSSFSGKPYRVKCGGAEAVASRAWLNRELQALRSARQASRP